MPFCPMCLAEFREGVVHCNSCGVDLVDRLAEEMDLSEESVYEALEGKELVVVTRGTLDVVKETRDILAGQRIASLVVGDEEACNHRGGAPSRVALVVGRDDLEAAGKVLGTRFQQMVCSEGIGVKFDLTYDTCPACGNLAPEDSEECPECGLFIGKA